MTVLEDVHVLPPDMRAGATGVLFDTLKTRRGEPVILDASAVERMDTLTAQLFAIAAKSWATDQQPFKIIQASEKLSSTMNRLGLGDLVDMEVDDNDN